MTAPAAPVIRRTDPRAPKARACLKAYYAELDARFGGGFDVSLSRDPEAVDMISPRGAFFVALDGAAPLGCAGFKGHDGAWAEVKRLWVAPAARGRGLATALMAEIETAARAMAIPLLRLDTNSALPEAAALYDRLGWTRIDRFSDDTYPDLFFEKALP